jgi:hypothetical protein
MAIATLSLNIDSIHDQVSTTLRALREAAERIHLIGAAMEEATSDLVAHSPAAELRRAGASTRAHVTGVLLNVLELAGKAERLELIAALYDAEDSPPSPPQDVLAVG